MWVACGLPARCCSLPGRDLTIKHMAVNDGTRRHGWSAALCVLASAWGARHRASVLVDPQLASFDVPVGIFVFMARLVSPTCSVLLHSLWCSAFQSRRWHAGPQ